MSAPLNGMRGGFIALGALALLLAGCDRILGIEATTAGGRAQADSDPIGGNGGGAASMGGNGGDGASDGGASQGDSGGTGSEVGPLSERRVIVSASGVTSAVELTLETPREREALRIDGSGMHPFAAVLYAGDAFEVSITSGAGCGLANAKGKVADADPIVTLACAPASLAGLTLLAPRAIDLGFSPDVLTYRATLPLLSQTARVVATAAQPDATVRLGAETLASGVPSSALPIPTTGATLSVSVASPAGAETRYTIDVSRDREAHHDAYVKGRGAARDDLLGYSVAIDGDTLVVGAPGDSEGAAASGAVYVFTRVDGAWRATQKLKAPRPDRDDQFGRSLALHGDTLAVGAYFEDSGARGVDGAMDDDSAPDSGAVFVLARAEGASTFTHEAYLKASNSEAGDEFGARLAVWGDTIAVGARYEDSAARGVGGSASSNGAEDSGAVYVFERASSSFRQTAYIKASDAEGGDAFGGAVALDRDTLVIGARYEDGAGGPVDSGAVYVFAREAGSFREQARLKASNAGTGDVFGWTVGISGDLLVVGAPGESSGASGVGSAKNDDSSPRSGAAYVFERVDSAWSERTILKAFNNDSDDDFGFAVGIYGDVVVVGAYSEDGSRQASMGHFDDNATNAGAAYVFYREGASFREGPYLKAPNADPGDSFGYSVAISQDAIAVGALDESSASEDVGPPSSDNGRPSAGAGYVFR